MGEALSQSPESEVEETVGRLFDAMRAGDGAAAAELFRPDAPLQSVSSEGGEWVVQTRSADSFVEAIGSARDEVWDERIWDLEVRVDDGLATAWMRYAFYLDDAFSHCGVNAFQLVRAASGWQILQVTDTRRVDDCGEPA
ncbi:MAG: DUF4440 domain-containing protein [Gemmatimonas sp.]|nr:DUF4440 domain-containing protein [Gemmatimonas sp.]